MRLIVKEVAEREGIASAYELANKTGIPVHSMYRIWNGEASMIALSTLDKLCTVLNVKPGQLFEHHAEPELLPGGGASQAEAQPSAKRAMTRRARPGRQATSLTVAVGR